MKKIENFIKKNTKLLVALIVWTIIISGITVYATTTYQANTVIYDNTSSNMASNNVQDALDELYERAITSIDSSYIDIATLQTNTNKTIIASSAGVCINRNGSISCFKKGNYNVEKEHLQRIFSDTPNSCTVYADYVGCDDGVFACDVDSDGWLYCGYNDTVYEECDVLNTGVDCYY